MRMSFVYEIALTGAQSQSDEARGWLSSALAETSARHAGLRTLDAYRPADGTHDPYNKDEGPPLLIVIAEFETVEALRDGAEALAQGLAHLPPALNASVTAMERRFYPVVDQVTHGTLPTSISYDVRSRH